MKHCQPGAVAVALLWSVLAAAQELTPADAIELERQGRLQEAADVWSAVAKRNPNDAGALASLGVVLSKEQKYQEAATAYRKALALSPRLPGLQLNLGLAEFKQGRFSSAIAPFRAALSADPKSMQARTLLGMSYYGAKQFAETVKYLQPAVNADPANPELRQVLAQSCLQMKNYSCALEEFRKTLEQNPDSAAAHVLTGEALDGLQKTREAIAEFQSAARHRANRISTLALAICTGNLIGTMTQSANSRQNSRSMLETHRRLPILGTSS